MFAVDDGLVQKNAAEGRRRTRAIQRAFWFVFVLNVSVALAKIIVGSVFGAASVRADGIHSIFDSAGNIAGFIGVALAARPADVGHPYGHIKYETYASFFIALLLLFAAYEVGGGAIQTLTTGDMRQDVSPVSFAVMIGTLVVNIIATTFERRQGKKYQSEVLTADSKHTLSDALVSSSVIIGLIFVQAGFPIADPIAALVVTAAIVVTAIDVLKDVHATFSDTARMPSENLRRCALGVDGVVDCHHIRTRGLANEVYVDMHILVDPEISIREAHAIANEVERVIKARFRQVMEVLVHLEPATQAELAEPATYEPSADERESGSVVNQSS